MQGPITDTTATGNQTRNREHEYRSLPPSSSMSGTALLRIAIAVTTFLALLVMPRAASAANAAAVPTITRVTSSTACVGEFVTVFGSSLDLVTGIAFAYSTSPGGFSVATINTVARTDSHLVVQVPPRPSGGTGPVSLAPIIGTTVGSVLPAAFSYTTVGCVPQLGGPFEWFGSGGLAVGPSGELVVVLPDEAGPRVRSIDASGVITERAGNGGSGRPIAGPALSSPLNFPGRPEVGVDGSLHFAEEWTSIIPPFTLVNSSAVVSVSPAGTLAVTGLDSARAVVPTPDENRYVLASLEGRSRVLKIAREGSTSTVYSSSQGLVPSDLALDPRGELVLAPATGAVAIQRITSAGAVAEVGIPGGVNNPAVAVDPNGTVFLAQGNGLFEIKADGTAREIGPLGGFDVAVTAAGDVLVLNQELGLVRYTGLAGPSTSFMINAVDDAASTTANTPVTIDARANDSVTAGGVGFPILLSAPTNGTATAIGPSVLYTPNNGFVGADSFTYRICNSTHVISCDTATVIVTVASPPPPPVVLRPVAPARLFDTRPGEPQGAVAVAKDKIGGATELRVKVTGVSGVPSSGVGAVSLNVTVAQPDGPGFVTVYPCGTRPLASNVNFIANQVVPNAVIAPVSPDGEICFYSNTPTHLLADISGWFANTAGFTAVQPDRLFDTRPGEPQGSINVDKQQVGGETVLRVKVTGVSGVPSSGVGAVSLNVTVAQPTGAGFVTVYPCGTRLLASNVNFITNQIIANAVIAPVSPDGEICFYSNTPTHLLTDINGWFATI